MSMLYVLSLIFKNNGIADIGYGGAFIVLIAAGLYAVNYLPMQAVLLVALVYLWGARLGIRIYNKNRNKPEDFRYKAWRDAWGKSFPLRSYFQIYLLQGLTAFLIALPVTLSIVYPAAQESTKIFHAGVAIWIIGFIFEVIGDMQLDNFMKNSSNRGKIMMSGLWRYTRHPNYFGESVMWWGMATAAAGLTAYPVIGFVSPILITFLLLRVSGVPLLEKRWEGKPEWEAYKAQTSVFFPMFPSKKSK